MRRFIFSAAAFLFICLLGAVVCFCCGDSPAKPNTDFGARVFLTFVAGLAVAAVVCANTDSK